MASPEEVAPLLPDTLPEDFSEWDGLASTGAMPGMPAAVQAGGESSRPLSLAAARGAGVAPGIGRPRSTRSNWAAPESLKKPEMPPRREEEGASPAALPRRDGGASLAERQLPTGALPEREARISSTVEWPRTEPSASAAATVRGSGVPATSVHNEQRAAGEAADRMPSRAQQRPESRNGAIEMPAAPVLPNHGRGNESTAAPDAKAAMTDEALFALFRENVEEEEAEKPVKSKQIIVAAVTSCILLLLLLLIPLFHRETRAAAKQSVQPSAVAGEVQQQANTAKPQAGRSSGQGIAEAKSGAQAAGNDASSSDAEAEPAPAQQDVQSAMMNEQLTAQARIPQEMKSAAVGSAPPPLNMGTDGMGGAGANSNIFRNQGEPVVHAAPSKPFAISAGVANGMLIQKTTPIYPVIAKQARISGTVVLSARISKTGSITDLRVVSGPAMLRESAMDAVRTWRYKPYELNHQPTEIETTINVVYSLGG